MRCIQTASSGVGKGVMALLAETWAMLCWFASQFHPSAERRGPRASSPSGWRGLIAYAGYFGIYAPIFLGIGEAARSLPELQAIGLQLAGVFVAYMIATYSRHLGTDIRLLRSMAMKLRMPWLVPLALVVSVAVAVVLATDSADAHPPSEANQSTDTVPHPDIS